MPNFLDFLKKEKPVLKTLLSEEEFLRFSIIQKEMSLAKAKKELEKFLKKRKK